MKSASLKGPSNDPLALRRRTDGKRINVKLSFVGCAPAGMVGAFSVLAGIGRCLKNKVKTEGDCFARFCSIVKNAVDID